MEWFKKAIESNEKALEKMKELSLEERSKKENEMKRLSKKTSTGLGDESSNRKKL